MGRDGKGWDWRRMNGRERDGKEWDRMGGEGMGWDWMG